MKPRNKAEKKAVEIYNSLPAITPQQEEWAYKAGKRYIHSNSLTSWCECCGGSFASSQLRKTKKAVCPHCGAKLEVRKASKLLSRTIQYCVCFLDTVEDYQIVRHFEVKLKTKKNNGVNKLYFVELQTVLFRGNIAFSFRRPLTNVYGGMALSRDVILSDTYLRLNDIAIYPEYKVLPIYRRNGFTTKVRINNTLNFLLALKYDNKLETLVKTGYYKLAEYYERYSYRNPINQYWASIKIAMRHHYKTNDWLMWFDYLQNMRELNMDLHNPTLICPKKSKKCHDLLMKKVNKRREIEREKAIAKKLMDEEQECKEYIERVLPFNNLCLTNGDIIIRVLKDVKEVKEEGDKMHHCVFTNECYKRKSSLLMSARDASGNRLETIELDLKTLKVLQSRGVNNSKTDKHDEILSIIESNINKIKTLNLQHNK